MNKKLSGVFTVILMINVLTSNIYAMEHLIDRNDREYSEILSLHAYLPVKMLNIPLFWSSLTERQMPSISLQNLSVQLYPDYDIPVKMSIMFPLPAISRLSRLQALNAAGVM